MATSTVNQVHGFTDPLTSGTMRKDNPDHFDTKMPRMYPILRHIHLYSVAKRGFQSNHVYYKGVLRGCGPTERFVLCYSVPDPPQQISVDCERGGKRIEVEPRDEAGWRVAIDILNPNNPSLDPYAKMGAKAAAMFCIGQGVDLIKLGLFPSLNSPPTEAELLKAEAARDESYDELITEAFQEQATNPQTFRAWLKANPDIHTAMTMRGVTADWATKSEIKQSCPNCGDVIKAGIAFHKSSAGVICILDPVRAAKAGVKAQQDDDEDEPRRGPGRPRKEPAV